MAPLCVATHKALYCSLHLITPSLLYLGFSHNYLHAFILDVFF